MYFTIGNKKDYSLKELLLKVKFRMTFEIWSSYERILPTKFEKIQIPVKLEKKR